jgi:hypothetical protein
MQWLSGLPHDVTMTSMMPNPDAAGYYGEIGHSSIFVETNLGFCKEMIGFLSKVATKKWTMLRPQAAGPKYVDPCTFK